MKEKIAHLEAHDARVERLSLLPGGVLEIAFKHVAAYIERSSELYDVWSFGMLLRVSDVREMRVAGRVELNDYISEASFHVDEREIGLSELMNGVALSRLDVVFASGAKLSVSCAFGALDSLTPVRVVEVWRGPLVSQ